MKRITVMAEIIFTLPDGTTQENADEVILQTELALNSHYIKALLVPGSSLEEKFKIPGAIGLRFHFQKVKEEE